MSQLWWYLARAGGIVSWALLSASVLWGLALSTKILGGRPRPNWMLDLHRFLGGLAVTFTGIHVLGLVADSYIHFGPTEILVPFTGSYRPAAVAWGIIGLYLLAAVEVTSLLRSHLPRKLWRLTHVLSFPLFAFATIHGIFAGTDAGSGSPLRWAMLGVSLAVVSLTVARIDAAMLKSRQPATPRIPAGIRTATAARTASSSPRSPRPAAPLTPPVTPYTPQEPVDDDRFSFAVDPAPTVGLVSAHRPTGSADAPRR